MSKMGSNDDDDASTTISPEERKRRQNRQSAQRARERKRRRLMEAERLEKRVIELEKRVCELESENWMLLNQMQQVTAADCTCANFSAAEYYLFPEICV